MNIKIIKTEKEYKDAVNYLEELGDSPNFENESKLIEEFELLEKLIQDYDKEHYFIEKGNPIEIIKLKMEYMNLKSKDLVFAIGSKGLVSEVLNKKRRLSKKMLRELSKLLNIGQEILNTEYELTIKCKETTKIKSKAKANPFNLSKPYWSDIERFSNNILQRGAILNVMSLR